MSARPPRGRGVNLTARRVPTLPLRLMSAFIDISTGAGLASSTGIRPYLPPLLAGGWRAATSRSTSTAPTSASSSRPRSSAAVVAVGVVAFFLERSARAPPPGRRAAERLVAGVVGLVLGALLFAGALADGGEAAWVGLLLGPLCAALGVARRRRARGARPRAARARPGGAPHGLRGRRRADPRGDRALRAAARAPRHPGLHRAARSAGAGARARSTPG